ncbi:MAG: glycosyltransferase 87 family protein [Clostridiales bacterium]
MVNKVSTYLKKDPYKIVFYITLSALLLFTILLGILTRGRVFESLLFYNQTDTFMDYFNSLMGVVARNPYDLGIIYPPLANLIYLINVHLIPTDYFIGDLSALTYSDTRLYQGYLIVFIIYSLISILAFIFICQNMKKGENAEKNTFVLLMLFSTPFFYCFERGNIIFLALIFSMLFFLWKDSDNKILRELSLIALAISAAIKIYPAIFGFLLIREKRWKEGVRLVFYGLFFFFVPFIFFGGFSKVFTLIENIFHTSSEFAISTFSYKLNFANTLGWLFQNNISSGIVSVFIIAMGCFGIIGCIILKSKWKAILFCVVMVIGLPSFSYVYTAIFMVIPLIYFLDTKEKRGKLDMVYLILMILTVAFIFIDCFIYRGNYNSHISISTMIESMALLLMSFLLVGDTIKEILEYFLAKRNKKINKNKEIINENS